MARRFFLPDFLVFVFSLVLAAPCLAQTTSTGAISGAVMDQSGAALQGASLTLTQAATNFRRQTQTDQAGRYSFLLLPPGLYDLEISYTGFKVTKQIGIRVRLNETTVLNVSLEVSPRTETVTVEAQPEVVQTTSGTLGRVVDERQIVNLPLATRNYTQILALSPGVVTNVANAGTLGRNSLEISANGGRLSDNNVQVNGADANNVFLSGLGDGSGGQGVAVPAPDTIQEYKVQTALYDASVGRNGGANVNVVTKSGTIDFHGNVYHFFRNEVLNANDFFRNRAGLPRPRLRQNQFGFTLGGPLYKDRAFFFVSYEGNRQSNGVTGGGTSTVFLPPITDDRSAASLGSQFGGQRGQFGGVAVASDGSNINPVALALLNLQLPNGDFLIPTPQIILSSGAGQSNFSVPAEYRENQFNINLDFRFTSKDTLSTKYFFTQLSNEIAFGGGASLPGFPSTNDGQNQNVVLAWTHIFRPNLLNDARIAYTRLQALGTSEQPIMASDVGINAPSWAPGLPNIGFLTNNLTFGASLPPLGSAVNNFQYGDTLSYVHGRHNVRVGAEIARQQSNVLFDFDKRTILRFITFPDFLLGLPFPANGAVAPFSNVYVSSARSGLIGRAQRMTDYSVYVQDDIALHPRFHLNLGVRYEVYGEASDVLGRLANFDPALAVTEPPPAGTFSGFVITEETAGSEPSEVMRLGRDTVIKPDRNNVGPRIGFAYRPFEKWSFVIRGGYGTYFSRPGTVILFQTGPNLPFAVISTRVGVPNNTASFQNPFDPTIPAPSDFPVYLPRFSNSSVFVNVMDPNLRSPTIHQWSLNTQFSFLRDYLVEIGYVGTRGTGLMGGFRFNQALLASATDPVHGQTTNTVQNARLRAPIQGVDPTTSILYANGFDSYYHSLQASLAKRFSHGLQFLASYTWSHNIDDLALGDLQAVGGYLGDVSDFRLNRGNADTDRRHRLVVNFYWELPRVGRNAGWGKLWNGWAFAGIGTFQSGLPFSITDTRGGTIFAISGSRAQLAAGASTGTIEKSGSVSSRLDGYFDTAGFVAPPTIGNGTGFGDSPRNFLRGPDQRNVDLAIIKRTTIGWPNDLAHIEFRSEFFNAFNTVNFGQPASNLASPTTLGVIGNTTVAPRIIQFALKYNF